VAAAAPAPHSTSETRLLTCQGSPGRWHQSRQLCSPCDPGALRACARMRVRGVSLCVCVCVCARARLCALRCGWWVLAPCVHVRGLRSVGRERCSADVTVWLRIRHPTPHNLKPSVLEDSLRPGQPMESSHTGSNIGSAPQVGGLSSAPPLNHTFARDYGCEHNRTCACTHERLLCT
jgi:hypothetical protein